VKDLVVRPYRPEDRPGVRLIYGVDEFAHPALQRRFPRMQDYLADSMSHYYAYEPESTFVALAGGQVVGALLGTVDTLRCERDYEPRTRRLLRVRALAGKYGWPAWWWADLLTSWAGREIVRPPVDLERFPAHLHIGLLPAWRRRGIGTQLTLAYEAYLRSRGIPGYHLYAASFHPLGMAFYQKSGMEILGRFEWRFHNGYRWLPVTETVFGRRLETTKKDGT